MNRDRLALTALVLLLTLPALGARDLWNPNEPTYGLAVREMIAADSWLIPTVNGERFLEKPPLFFWLARGASALLGEAPFALRLPSVLAAWLGVLSVFSIARRFGERRSGWIAAGVFFSLAAVAQTARQVQMDLLLTSCVAAALALALSEKRGRALLAGLALGAGVLAKGPVAILAFGLPWLALRLPWRRLPEVTLGLVLAVMPWLSALAIQGELGVLNEMFFRQSVTRYLDAWDHAQPAWYYLKYLWIDFPIPSSWISSSRSSTPVAGWRSRQWAWC